MPRSWRARASATSRSTATARGQQAGRDRAGDLARRLQHRQQQSRWPRACQRVWRWPRGNHSTIRRPRPPSSAAGSNLASSAREPIFALEPSPSFPRRQRLPATRDPSRSAYPPAPSRRPRRYYNFYGEWQLSDALPLCNERPHYQHDTMYGGEAHLFHVLDSHYNVPRWVIGPSPGNENGWAFCESDARYPQEISGEWISWDGVSWHSTATLRFIVPDEGAEDDESDYGEEAALESLYIGTDGEAAAERQQPASRAADGAGVGGSSSSTSLEIEPPSARAGSVRLTRPAREAAAEGAAGVDRPRAAARPPPGGGQGPKPASRLCIVM